MTEFGDLYELWLEIPASEQPPDFYRLLGLQRFESSQTVIVAAIERTMARVAARLERCQESPQVLAAGQALLQHVTKAADCLSDSSQKATYDFQLQAVFPTTALPTAVLSPGDACDRGDAGDGTSEATDGSIASDGASDASESDDEFDDLPPPPPLPSSMPADPLPNVRGDAIGNDVFGNRKKPKSDPNAKTAAWQPQAPTDKYSSVSAQTSDAGSDESATAEPEASEKVKFSPTPPAEVSQATDAQQDEWIIGSSSRCDIQVESVWASKRHCQLSREGDKLVLADLDSTNGTFVNRRRISAPQVVTTIDLITLGRETRVRLPAEMFPTAQQSLSVIYLGRLEDNDLQLTDHSVSSYHARIVRDGDQLTLEDLGSTNGTFVSRDGVFETIDRQVIDMSDEIKIGGCVIACSDAIKLFDAT